MLIAAVHQHPKRSNPRGGHCDADIHQLWLPRVSLRCRRNILPVCFRSVHHNDDIADVADLCPNPGTVSGAHIADANPDGNPHHIATGIANTSAASATDQQPRSSPGSTANSDTGHAGAICNHHRRPCCRHAGTICNHYRRPCCCHAGTICNHCRPCWRCDPWTNRFDTGSDHECPVDIHSDLEPLTAACVVASFQR
jgi:hypothetical protein